MYEIYVQMKYFMTVYTKLYQLYKLLMYSPNDLNFKTSVELSLTL